MPKNSFRARLNGPGVSAGPLLVLLASGALLVGLVAAGGEQSQPAGKSTGETSRVSERSTPEADASGAAPAVEATGERPRPYERKTLRGRFVWMNEALHRRFGVQTPLSLRESIPTLETTEGELVPLIEDRRGRAFRKDGRLREMDLELEVRIHRGSPMAQIIHVHEYLEGVRYVIDYWCDICSIAMYEFGPCDCCQDQNRLRRRPAP